jgi:SAM-dependent methyltransferase
MDHTKPALSEHLSSQLRAWESRPLLRRFYSSWFDLVERCLAPVAGVSVELGSGIGGFAQGRPHIVATDVEETPWAELVADGENLPFDDGAVANLVLIDVFHHLAAPARFMSEAVRVLHAGGRVVMIEPYCSPLSTIAYRRFHEEDLDLTAEALVENPSLRDAPMDANIAQPTIAFFRRWDVVQRMFPELALVERRRITSVGYVLSGGYSRAQLVPSALYPLLALFDAVLSPFAWLVAFRSVIVLERLP